MWPPKHIDVFVLSRQLIKTATFEKPYMLVSIRNYGDPPAELSADPNRKAVLFIAFDDATPQDRRVAKPITKAQARLIWVFFDTYIGQVEALVCQCEAGQSRSAAVAKALIEGSCIPGNDAYLNQPRFHPNYYVKLVLDRVRRQGTRWVCNDEWQGHEPVWKG